MIFNQLTLKGVAKTGKKYVVTDESRPGFSIKVSAAGKGQFYYRYKKHGVRREIPLGVDFEPAMALYQSCRDNTHSESITIPDKVDSDALFAEGWDFPRLSASYLADHVLPNLSRSSEDMYARFLDSLNEYLLAKHPAVYHGRSNGATARKAIKAYLLTLISSRPILCNRSRSCYSSMFKWGFQMDYVTENPVHDMPSAVERAKTVHMVDSELEIFFPVLSAGQNEESTKDALCLILLTMLRSGEVLSIRPDMVNLDKRRLIIPKTKNGRPHLVPLSGPAMIILEKRMQAVGSPSERLFKTSSWGLRQVSRRICARADVTVCGPHDLRRTAATLAASLRVSRHIISKLLNHTASGVTEEHYIMYDLEEERLEALEKLAVELLRLGLPTHYF